MAATVINPRGGWTAFLEINFRAFLKLQNVSGYLGYIKSTFIPLLLIAVSWGCFNNSLLKQAAGSNMEIPQTAEKMLA
jgi:hypothetical protein